jgi:hypothetical protein
VPSGVPLIVWWYYDGANSPSGHFEITFHDSTT